MSGPELLAQHAGKLKTRVGACYPGSRAVFRGHDLHAELADMAWMDMYVFSITARRFSAGEMRLLQAIWTYTSYPDARIWNNRIAALAGSARSTGVLGTSAALAVSEASIYGGGIIIRAIDFFQRARQRTEAGEDLDACLKQELQAQRSIAGYGRPIAAGDERIPPMLSLAKELGLDQGPHLRIAFDVEERLRTGRWRMKMNYAALVAALGADLGFSARQFYLFVFPAFLAGMLPCTIEAAERPEGALFPIACGGIQYEGLPQRSWRTEKAQDRS